jgi:hypothetical protein
MTIKPYQDVQIGDKVYHCENDDYVGVVIWKGKATELDENEFISWEMEAEEIDEHFDLVLISEDMESIGNWDTLYNYNNDPCGVYSKIEDIQYDLY